MLVSELIEQLADADPDSVVLYLDSYADVEDSDEICEVLVDSNLWTHEEGVNHGESYKKRYPCGPRISDAQGHEVLSQSLERVVVLSNGPTNLRYLTTFQPDARQHALIEHALTSHRRAQMFGRYAPSRLVRKWTSENPTNRATSAQRTGRRFFGVSRLSSRRLTTVPLAVRHALGTVVGARLYWFLTADGLVSIRVMPSRRRQRTSRDPAR